MINMGKKTATDFKLQSRMENVIAQGCLTNSKSANCFVKGVYPTHISSAYGPYLYDSKNNTYVDYICGLGTCLMGYNKKEISDVAINELLRGFSYSLPSITEVNTAERIREIIPFIDRIKFLKTGSEAANGALVIARNYTKRQFVLSEGYHGWGGEFTSLTPPASGVNPQTYIHKLNDPEQINSQIAAVIVEPVDLDNSVDRIIRLKKIREKCDQHGVVLIFDEIITGFRYKNWCVAKNLSITPDLILMGKCIAGGLPLALIGGKKDLMDDKQYFLSSTFAGENVSLAACTAMIDLLVNKYDINDLWKLGDDFISAFNCLWPERIQLQGYATRARFFGDDAAKFYFWQEAVKAGILFGPSWFISFAHQDVQFKVLDHLKDIILKMKSMKELKLEGESPKSPFSLKART